MRRKDREVQDKTEVFDILKRCDTVRIGMQDNQYPYKHGLKVLLAHYGYHEYPLDRCMGISHLLVGKIVLGKITGKRNLPGAMISADQAAINHN